jgi:hypothetical protein
MVINTKHIAGFANGKLGKRLDSTYSGEKKDSMQII